MRQGGSQVLRAGCSLQRQPVCPQRSVEVGHGRIEGAGKSSVPGVSRLRGPSKEKAHNSVNEKPETVAELDHGALVYVDDVRSIPKETPGTPTPEQLQSHQWQIWKSPIKYKEKTINLSPVSRREQTNLRRHMYWIAMLISFSDFLTCCFHPRYPR